MSPDLRYAVDSPCGRHRYLLRRTWGEGPLDSWVLLHPSRQSGVDGDCPRVRRCAWHSRRDGYAGLAITYLFSARADTFTELARYPRDEASLLGPDWYEHFAESTEEAARVVCAWGRNGHLLQQQDFAVRDLAARGRPMAALQIDRGGWPLPPSEHPMSSCPRECVMHVNEGSATLACLP